MNSKHAPPHSHSACSCLAMMLRCANFMCKRGYQIPLPFVRRCVLGTKKAMCIVIRSIPTSESPLPLPLPFFLEGVWRHGARLQELRSSYLHDCESWIWIRETW